VFRNQNKIFLKHCFLRKLGPAFDLNEAYCLGTSFHDRILVGVMYFAKKGGVLSSVLLLYVDLFEDILQFFALNNWH